MIYRAVIAAAEYSHMKDVFSDEDLIGHFYNPHVPIPAESNDLIQLGAVAHELIPAQPPSDKTFFPVNIQLRVADDDLLGVDDLEVLDLRLPLLSRAVFFLQLPVE